jgi:hypothetical protein
MHFSCSSGNYRRVNAGFVVITEQIAVYATLTQARCSRADARDNHESIRTPHRSLSARQHLRLQPTTVWLPRSSVKTTWSLAPGIGSGGYCSGMSVSGVEPCANRTRSTVILPPLQHPCNGRRALVSPTVRNTIANVGLAATQCH